jgi:HSP20 family molecular chaperone IbpA
MDTNHNTPQTRSNKTITVIIGATTLILGLVIGAAAESGTGIFGDRGAAKSATGPMQSPASNHSQSATVDEWNPFQEIRDMQAQMDRMFNQMNQQFQGEAGFHGFNDIPGYSLSLDVRDMKDRYEVHAWLPDAKASDVHVSLANNQTLKVEVNSQQTEKTGGTNVVSSVAELGQYEQTVQLPTPVKAAQMKVTRNGHDLVISIPKAN